MSQKVTFLVPAFNALPEIRFTVDSMINQTLRDFHAIIIDDGSTDGTSEWLDSIRDSRFQIVHQENTGYVTALNRGAALVRTPYFARLDADDLAMPDRLSKQVHFLERNPNVAVVGSRTGYIFLRKRRFIIQLGPFQIKPEVSPQMLNPPFWDPIIDGQNIAHPSATIRMSAFREVGGYREIPPAEDYDLWLRFRDSGYLLACLPDVLCLYRISTESVSSQAYYKQIHVIQYAAHCHSLRSRGEQEPTFDEYVLSHPLNDQQVKDAKLRLRLRNSMGNLLAGKFAEGGAGILSVIAKNPRHFWRKFRSRC